MLGFSIGNGITLLHVEPQTARLFFAGDHLDCRYVRAYFKENGIPAAQYIQPGLSSLYDTAEDLIALGHDLIAVHATAASYRLCRRVTSLLKELDPDIRIVWFGAWASRLGEVLLQETEADGIVVFEPELVLHIMLATDLKNWPSISGAACRAQDDNGSGRAESASAVADDSSLESAGRSYRLDGLPNVWMETASSRQAPLLCVKLADLQGAPDSVEQGLRLHSPERLRQDLKQAIEASKQSAPVLELKGFALVEDPDLIDRMIAVLSGLKDLCRYRLEIPYRQWSGSLLERLAEAGVVHFDIRLPMYLQETWPGESGGGLREAMARMKHLEPQLRFSAILEEADSIAGDSSMTASLLRDWAAADLIRASELRVESLRGTVPGSRIELPEPLAAYMAEQSPSEPEPAFMNGYVAYMTGMYPRQALGGGVKHIGGPEEAVLSVEISRLEEHFSINSALFIEHNQVNREENEGNVFFDEDQVLKRQHESFNRVIDAFGQQHYLSNAHHIAAAEPYSRRLQLNDYLHLEPIHIHQAEYSQAEHIESAGDEPIFTMLEIKSEQDMEAFLHDVDGFTRTGTFRHGYEVKSYLLDSCRWSSANVCSVKQLPRLFMDEQSELSPCRGCASIGSLHDSPDSLLTQAAVISDQEQLLRGCAVCPIKDSCSKCAFLPAYLNRQQYCDIRKKHTMLHRYMQTVQLFKGLSQHTQALKGLDRSRLQVSLPTSSRLLPPTIARGGPSAAAEAVFLLWVDGAPLIYNALRQKLLRLSEPMAAMLEGLIAGVDKPGLRQMVMELYGADPEQAEAAVSQGLELFAKEGCLQWPAKAS